MLTSLLKEATTFSQQWDHKVKEMSKEKKWYLVSEPDNRGAADGQVQSSPETGVWHADHSAGHQPADAQC